MSEVSTKNSSARPAPFRAMAKPIPLEAVRWTSEFWADIATRCRDVMVPAMGRLMTETERVKFIGNFLVASGAEPGRHRGPRWNDGDFMKWFEAAASLLLVERDAELESELDDLIKIIAAAQRDDGYLHTDVQIRERNGEAVEPFGKPMDFEMYNMGHLISAACVHHRATGKTNLLSIATKSADFLDRVFESPTEAMARHGICPSHLMALTDLYRLTGEQKYLNLAVRLLEMRNLVTKGDDDNQDRLPFREHSVAHGHAVRATYLYAGMADIFLETGDETLLPPLRSVWHDLVSRKLYITGGCGALFDGASPDGVVEQLGISRVHQAFGRDYQLPQSTAHNETCAAIGNILWSWRLFQITGESKFIDLIEQTLFNSVLAGVDLGGTKYFYTNTLRQLEPMPVPLRWNRHREEIMGCYCCPPNVVRTLAQVGGYAYALRDDAIAVLLYGGNRATISLSDGTQIVLNQQTEYPWDGRVEVEIESIEGTNNSFAIDLRIPDWSATSTVAINGGATEIADANAFHRIDRVWSVGDRIALEFDMSVRLIEAHPLVEESRGQVAIVRGPIAYCLESADLPAGTKLLDIAMPIASRWTAVKSKSHFNGEIPILRGAALARRPRDWTSSLYQSIEAAKLDPIEIALVPYFAWDNRGDGEMSVWLPAVFDK